MQTEPKKLLPSQRLGLLPVLLWKKCFLGALPQQGQEEGGRSIDAKFLPGAPQRWKVPWSAECRRKELGGGVGVGRIDSQKPPGLSPTLTSLKPAPLCQGGLTLSARVGSPSQQQFPHK